MKWTNEFLDKKRFVTDATADQLVSSLIEEHGIQASRELFDKLIRNIELPLDQLPKSIKVYFTAPWDQPDWLSKNDIVNSNKLFIDHGPKFLLLLYFKSLPLLYTDAKGAKVLVKTSRLTNKDQSLEIFSRRIAETGQFLLEVMSNKNSRDLKPLVVTIRKVRLIHAAIRNFISEDWNESMDGKPINQEDMALTLLTFSISLLDGLNQLFIEEKPELLDAYYNRWKAIGLVLGVEQEMIPENIDEARMLLNIILDRNSKRSEAGLLLTKSLVDFSKNAIPGKVIDTAPEILISYFIGEELSNHLGLGNKFGCLGFAVPSFLSTLFGIGETLEGNSQKVNEIANKLSLRLMHAMVNYFNKYKNRNFSIPEEFNSWFSTDKN